MRHVAKGTCTECGMANVDDGLHGARTHCFECGKPVEQIPMVPVAEIRSGSGEEQ